MADGVRNQSETRRRSVFRIRVDSRSVASAHGPAIALPRACQYCIQNMFVSPSALFMSSDNTTDSDPGMSVIVPVVHENTLVEPLHCVPGLSGSRTPR